MERIRARLRAGSNEEGLSLIEVLVAMMIFAMMAIGIAYALTSTLTLTRDNKAREVAVSLAATEIDAARAIGDPFLVLNANRSQTVGGDEFQIRRVAAWVTPTGADSTCGTSGGALQYKRVSVTVTWNGMRSTDAPVITDTLMVPSSRINDPALGTILVSILNAEGTGMAGIPVTATSSVGNVAGAPTDADGCSFLLKVTPGTYTIKLSQAGYIDYAQVNEPTITKKVDAGSSTDFSFQYDRVGTFNVTYASNNTGPAPKIPNGMDTSFVNSYGVSILNVSSNVAKLHPYPVGYQAFAGKYLPQSTPTVGCTSVDPEAWAPDTRVDPALVGLRPEPVAALPGGATTIPVPMGIVTVTGGTAAHLTAVSQSDVPIPGQPACTQTMTYKFGSVVPTSGSVKIALPFGSWKLFTSTTASGPTTLLPADRITLVTPGAAPDAAAMFALDPRWSSQ